MSALKLAQDTWSDFSDKTFIQMINHSSHKSLTKLNTKIRDEFIQRNLDYSNLLSSQNQSMLFLENGICLWGDVLLEKEPTLPPLVSNFYLKVLYPTIQKLQNHPLLKEKQLVTTKAIRGQMFMTERIVKTVQITDLAELTNNDIFIFININGVIYPNLEETIPFLKNTTYVIFKRKQGFRYFGDFKIIDTLDR